MPEPMKTPRHPAEDRIDFWRNEHRIASKALEASKRENIELERHYRAALQALNAAGIAPPIPEPNA